MLARNSSMECIFKKSDGKRGRPALNAACATCGIIYAKHYREAKPEKPSDRSIEPDLHAIPVWYGMLRQEADEWEAAEGN